MHKGTQDVQQILHSLLEKNFRSGKVKKPKVEKLEPRKLKKKACPIMRSSTGIKSASLALISLEDSQKTFNYYANLKLH
ncbi:hypothetical protein HUJ05_007605 [Dendroctonus ponderosae]|nr:hypothetical protein HUJ05_007605 [Dendroctonus ponderosae]